MSSPLDILLIPLGSAGDVHPFLGLASRLKRRGHRPVVVTNPHFEPHVRRLGLELVPLGTAEEFDTVTNDPDLWHPWRGFKIIVRHAMLGTLRDIYDVVRERYRPGRTVAVTQATALGARIARDKLGIPLVTVHLQPAVLRSVHDTPTLPPMWTGPRVPRWLKRAQYWMVDRFVADRQILPELNAFRAELGLRPVHRVLDAWWNSPDKVVCLFPEWFASRQPDWPAATVVTDFPLWDEAETREVPTGLDEFLATGDPPIVFTPGSAMRQGHEFFTAAVDACRRLGRRGLLLTQYDEHLPQPLPEEIARFEYVPFSRVFPRAAAVVHHGGIGTLAQSFAAGVPQLVMPMSHDQPDNAARVVRLGVGRSIRPEKFRGKAVARELAALLDQDNVARRCQELATAMRGRDGLEEASDAIEAVATGTVQ